MKKWDILLVGTLASDEYVEQKTGRQSVFINNQNSAQFNIRLISDTPESFPNQELFSGFASDIEPYEFVDEVYEFNQNIRRDNVKEFFRDKLLVFKPVKKHRVGQTDVYQVSEVKVQAKPLAYHEGTTFMPVPVFSKKTHGYDYDEFIERLVAKKFLGNIEGFPIDQDYTSNIVMWQEVDESIKIVGEFESHRHAHGGFAFQYTNLRTVEFFEEWGEESFIEGSIMFVGMDAYLQMTNEIQSSPGMVEQDIQADKREKDFPEKDGVTEGEFYSHFVRVSRERGLFYDDKDLVNFHAAMKTSGLVILAGMSGTGKSALVETYARALGMSLSPDDRQFAFIPVRPSWTDDSDLLGYVDSLHHVYRPGDSGLVDTLIKAAENPNRLYVVCFDEMNLARVEHYFSQFLSVLEIAQPNRRVLNLYNEELAPRLYNSDRYMPRLPIGENVLFVGTVNLDESTHHFSDKVLDRANVISLRVLSFAKIKEMKTILQKHKEPVEKMKEVTTEEFRVFRKGGEGLELSDAETQFLEEIHELLQKASKNLGVGHRIIRQIEQFLANIPEEAQLSRREAFDLQIVQRVMTKLRGPEDLLKPVFGTYDAKEGIVINSEVAELMDRFSEVSDFEESKKTLLSKARELKVHGYAL